MKFSILLFAGILFGSIYCDYLPGQACPKYTCTKETNTTLFHCLQSNNTSPLNVSGVISVLLDNQICNQTAHETCQTQGLAPIWTQPEFNATCAAPVAPLVNGTRLPGETCIYSTDCMKTAESVPTCTSNGTCVGVYAGGNCTSHMDCVVGLSCNAVSKTCAAQLQIGAVGCNDSGDCVNTAFCNLNATTKTNGTCTATNTLADNATFVLSVGGFNEDPHSVCLSGDSFEGTCTTIDYAAGTLANVNADGLVRCNDTTYSCLYTNNQPRACGCGYNADGNAYCPVPSARTKKQTKELAQARNNLNNAACHTMHRRETCTLGQDNSVTTVDINQYNFETTTKHLYYNAVPCARDVLGGSSISYSYVALLVLLAFFL